MVTTDGTKTGKKVKPSLAATYLTPEQAAEYVGLKNKNSFCVTVIMARQKGIVLEPEAKQLRKGRPTPLYKKSTLKAWNEQRKAAAKS